MVKKVLTIAGLDVTGGAGQSADLKVFAQHHCYGLNALTCIVSFSEKNNFQPEIYPVHNRILQDELDTISSLEPMDAIKTGMLPSEKQIHLVAQWLKEQAPKGMPIVIDPVMACKRNGEEDLKRLRDSIAEELLPFATVTTPNLVEAEALAQMEIHTKEDMVEAAKRIYDLGAKNVVIKGGARLEGAEAVDLLYDGTSVQFFEAKKITDGYNHGAGCSFAAAITANLAQGKDMVTAVREAKYFIYTAIQNGVSVGEYVQTVFVNP